MVGVGEESMSRELQRGVQLTVHTDWESDETLIYTAETLDGALPGPGCTFYSLVIERRGDPSSGEALKEFSFTGGGHQRIGEVPPIVRSAFEEWYGRLLGRLSPSVR